MNKRVFGTGILGIIAVAIIAGGTVWMERMQSTVLSRRAAGSAVPTYAPTTPMQGLDPRQFVLPSLSETPTPTAARYAPLSAARFVPTLTPQKQQESSTGAIMVAPPEQITQEYEQLYALLEYGPVFENTFMIIPIKKKRRIEIYVASPSEKNTPSVMSWLEAHGYGNLPSRNVVYYEL